MSCIQLESEFISLAKPNQAWVNKKSHKLHFCWSTPSFENWSNIEWMNPIYG
jgi:hypothetical protein